LAQATTTPNKLEIASQYAYLSKVKPSAPPHISYPFRPPSPPHLNLVAWWDILLLSFPSGPSFCLMTVVDPSSVESQVRSTPDRNAGIARRIWSTFFPSVFCMTALLAFRTYGDALGMICVAAVPLSHDITARTSCPSWSVIVENVIYPSKKPSGASISTPFRPSSAPLLNVIV